MPFSSPVKKNDVFSALRKKFVCKSEKMFFMVDKAFVMRYLMRKQASNNTCCYIKTMKMIKKLGLATSLVALCSPALAGTPEVTVVAPPVAPEPAASTSKVEIGVSHMWAGHDIIDNTDVVNTLGGDLTFVEDIDANSAATLRLGYAWGYGDVVGTNNLGQPLKWKLRMHNITVMPGYRYSQSIADGITAFAGVNAGVINSSLKNSIYVTGVKQFTQHDSEWGFAYSAELGLSFNVAEDMDVFVAYQFAGSTAKPLNCDTQTYHGVRAGVTMKF